MTIPDVRSPRIPGKIKLAIVGLWLHAALLAFAAFFTLVDAQSMAERDETDVGPVLTGGLMVTVMVVLLALAAVQVTRRVPWGRVLAIVLESFGLFSGSIGLIVGLLVAPDLVSSVVMLAFIAFVSTVSWLLLNGASRAWFEAGSHESVDESLTL